MNVSDSKLSHTAYRPDIDGLRAVAVTAVVGFHMFYAWIPGGFIGVDIFFVISGYLISLIIFGTLEKGTFSILEFYRRRVRRIFPALILVIAATLIAGWFILLNDEYQKLGKHTAASALFIENFMLWNENGYFDWSSETKPFLHLWSLAIEEQFYLFWPLLLAFIWKRNWNFLYITLGFGVFSFISNICFSYSDLTRDFYSPQSRFWELMTGSALAYITLHKPALLERHNNLRSILGFSAIVFAIFYLDRSMPFPGWCALLPTAGAFLLISAGPAAWLNRNILANRGVVFIGLISYPLYLWHWPLLSLTVIAHPPKIHFALKMVLIAYAVLLATLTYLYIEHPIRKRSRPMTQDFYPLLAGMALVLMLGLCINSALILPRLYTFQTASRMEWDFIKSTRQLPDSNATGEYYYKGNGQGTTLYIGDSQVAQYVERIVYQQNATPESNNALFMIGGGCIPIPGVFSDIRERETCWPNRSKA